MELPVQFSLTWYDTTKCRGDINYYGQNTPNVCYGMPSLLFKTCRSVLNSEKRTGYEGLWQKSVVTNDRISLGNYTDSTCQTLSNWLISNVDCGVCVLEGVGSPGDSMAFECLSTSITIPSSVQRSGDDFAVVGYSNMDCSGTTQYTFGVSYGCRQTAATESELTVTDKGMVVRYVYSPSTVCAGQIVTTYSSPCQRCIDGVKYTCASGAASTAPAALLFLLSLAAAVLAF